jgi:NitT/TauT family transport system ATP-binding protein
VDSGEFVSVVGPSGCGKSTLLRLASGLDSPTSGRVDVATKRVGYVFQDPTLLPWRTVRRNVELLAELEHLPKAERQARVTEAIGLVGLRGFEKHRPRALSGGADAHVAGPLAGASRRFLFDEPFGALDEMSRGINDELPRCSRPRVRVAHHPLGGRGSPVHRVAVMSPRPGQIRRVDPGLSRQPTALLGGG